MFEDTDIFY